MSVDPVGESAHRTDHDVLGKLAAIDQRLHQIQTQLNTMSKLPRQLDEISANLETLIESLDQRLSQEGAPRWSTPLPLRRLSRLGKR